MSRSRFPALLLACALALTAGRAQALGVGLSKELVTLPGVNAGDRFGAALAGDFDWDGDGRPDLAVGAYAYPKGQGSGRVYLFRAGSALDDVPDWQFGGVATTEYFGYSLATAHDINGDGWNDLVVGVPRGRGAALYSGRVLVYFGGPAADTVADLRLSGVEPNQQFGISVAVPGDVNGDGWDDILAGSYNPLSFRGTVSLFLGGPARDSVPVLVLHSGQLRDNLGYAVSGAGDINGDGLADFVVSAPYWSPSSPSKQEGRVYVYFGGATPDTVPDLVLNGATQNRHLGQFLGNGGDVDGDGFADLLIGDSVREVLLYRGGVLPDDVPDAAFPEVAGVAGAGDVNGDGGNDLAFAGRERGQVALGGAELDTIADYTLARSGLAAGGDGAVARVGDLTGDGGADFAVGLQSETVNGAARGAVHVVAFGRYFLLAPNGGEDWIAGAVDTVKWLGSDSLRVELSLDAGASWSLLAIGSGGGAGRLPVLVPDTLSAEALIRILPPAGQPLPNQTDASDATFRIIAHSLVGPPAPRSWLAGDTDSVTWRGTRLADIWMVGRRSGAKFKLASGVGGLPANSFEFRVPMMNDDSVFVRLLAAGVDVENGTALTAAAPSVIRPFEFTSPNEELVWVSGETAQVSWRGREPADVWLVPDIGPPVELASGAGGAATNTAGVVVPLLPAGYATLRVVAAEAGAGSSLADSSTGLLTVKPFDILYPDGGEEWIVGHADSIVWRGAFPADIAFQSASGAAIPIATGRGGEARNVFTFVVPLLEESDVRARVTLAPAGPGPPLADSSAFSLRVVPFRIQRPRGGLVWPAGGVDSVLWTGPSPATIDLSTDAGTTWIRLADGVGGLDVNSARVQVPEILTARAVVRVSVAGASSSPGHSVTTAGLFVITRPDYLPGANLRRMFVDSTASAKDQLGYSVADAGDVNGDGYHDLIVGRPNATVAGQLQAGIAQIYLGGPGADGVPDIVLLGDDPGDHFGWTVSSAGDFNGDGYDDVAVGAPDAVVGAQSGQVKVFFGGPNMDATADVALSDAHLVIIGYTLSAAGDVNGDGYDDIVAGANVDFGTGGQVYVPLYLGGPNAGSVREIRLLSGTVSGTNSGSYGSVVAGAGDVNGDGRPDIAVGASSTVSNDTLNRVFIFFGRESIGDMNPDMSLRGNRSAAFGGAIAPLGDFDGDGYDDLAVGAYFWNGPRGPVGRVTIYPGGPAFGQKGYAIDGPLGGERFGRSLAGRTDFNGDGFPDLAIGAEGSDVGGQDAGRVYVHFGSPAPDSIPDVVLDGPVVRGQFGYSVAMVPRFAETDFGVLAVGSPQAVSGTAGGRVNLYEVVHPTLLTPVGGETWVAGEPAEIRWRGAPRVNVELTTDNGSTWGTLAEFVGGDDTNLFTLVAPATSTREARVRIRVPGEPMVRSNTDVTEIPFRIVPRNPDVAVAMRLRAGPAARGAGERAGERVVAAGDVNGDGVGDRLVLARAGSAPDALARVELVLGGASSPSLVVETPGTGGEVELAGLGDLDRDGFAEFGVGVPDDPALGPATGRVYVFRGGAVPDADPDLVLTGLGPGARFGSSLGAAGDLDHDGFADFAVGSPGAGASPYGGAVSLYRGGPVLGGAAWRTLHGSYSGDGFGAAVAGPGDLNGDGVDDLAIGSPRRIFDNDAAGRVIAFFGASAFDTTQDLVIRGASEGESFGATLAAAGDVNDDGFPDLLVGAPSNDDAGTDAGRAYICMGGERMKSVPTLAFPGHTRGAYFGAALAAGRDLNGDGFTDFAIGAPLGGGEDRGEVSLFFGGVLPDSLADHVWTGSAPGDHLGASVAMAGNAEAGAYGALVIGAPFADGSDAGAAPAADAGGAFEWESLRFWVASPGSASWVPGAEERVTWLGAERARVSLVGASGAEVVVGDSLGGADTNQATLRVPAGLGGWARVHVTPSRAGVSGEAWSDTVRIESEVSLTRLSAVAVSGGVELAWATEPGVGPQGLAGYRVYRISPLNGARELVADSVKGTRLFYAERDRRARYALSAVNGLSEEMALGETGLSALAEGMRVWPVPMGRAGLTLELAVPVEGDGETAGDFAVEVYDVTGRKVADIAHGKMTTEVGRLRLAWDGRSSAGEPVAAGLYFVRARAGSLHYEFTRRVVVR